ncbi:hypothetical protein AB1L88_17680 [Tautonia sp. JC769]|uniref:hypothetical protein n=1 Tax=Tautonia sp. JC769 TaxID=3232135 RepID=UPI003459D59D
MARRDGRGAQRQRVIGRIPQGLWKAVTPTAAMRLDGVAGRLAFDGATEAATLCEMGAGRPLKKTFKAISHASAQGVLRN